MNEEIDLMIKEVLDSCDAWGKIRSILREAMAGGTKAQYRQGCRKVLALVDAIDPVMLILHGTRETFAPEKGAEHA